MSLRRSLFTLTATAGLAMSAALTAPAAVADSAAIETDVSINAYADCPVGWFCVWDQPGGGGEGWARMARFQTGVPDLRVVNMDNQISSLWNRTGRVWCVYTGPGYTGSAWQVGNWQGDAPPGLNDDISSLRPC
ncbi:peptidase inhibitor family I36 protein [Streptomyces sp. NPDC003006]